MAAPRITADQVKHVARLAALEFDEGAVETMRSQLDAILDYMAALDALDASSVEPMFYPVPMSAPLREDRAVACPPRAELLAAAPRTESGAFAVPRVLDGEG